MMDCAVIRRRGLQDEAAGLFATPSYHNEDSKVDALIIKERSESNMLSPLLRLPAEIRNQIYTLVLGTNSLHVYARDSTATGTSKVPKVLYYPCLHQKPAEKRCNEPEWLKKHIPCFTAEGGSSRLPFSELMLTCRQIRTETRLLPFSTNIFAFVTPSSMQNFLESTLAPEQAKALRSLSIWTGVAPMAPAAPGPALIESLETAPTWKSWVPSSRIVDGGLLQGLQELNLSISIYDDGTAGEGEWRDMKEIRGLFEFRALATLKRVRVAVGHSKQRGIGEGEDVVRAYADEVRDRILGTFVSRPVIFSGEE